MLHNDTSMVETDELSVPIIRVLQQRDYLVDNGVGFPRLQWPLNLEGPGRFMLKLPDYTNLLNESVEVGLIDINSWCSIR